ncbi:4 glycosyl hydrolase family protein, partial [Vibrio parahaemolyticus V-223/04]
NSVLAGLLREQTMKEFLLNTM